MNSYDRFDFTEIASRNKGGGLCSRAYDGMSFVCRNVKDGIKLCDLEQCQDMIR
jgi:hypothetical protein